jgi:hypothetical protein
LKEGHGKHNLSLEKSSFYGSHNLAVGGRLDLHSVFYLVDMRDELRLRLCVILFGYYLAILVTLRISNSLYLERLSVLFCISVVGVAEMEFTEGA